MSLYERYGKRGIDILGATIIIVVAAPLFVMAGIIVKCGVGGPILFSQRRGGHKGHVFRMVKFRTMTEERDANGLLLPDERRLTPAGQFLRTFGFDELPQLFHVLTGQMSLVGPRPFVACYLDHYTVQLKKRHDVRPGITGLAQVNGRNALSWEEKFHYDLKYIDQMSLWLDLKILFRTVFVVVSKQGVTAPGHATMPRWSGQASKQAMPMAYTAMREHQADPVLTAGHLRTARSESDIRSLEVL